MKLGFYTTNVPFVPHYPWVGLCDINCLWCVIIDVAISNVTNCATIQLFQRRRCCAFDSPGLPNDSAGYPGLMYGLWGTTPSVLCFFWLIRHKRFHYNHAFIEKAQHLWRWISLRTFTRGRLVPRQPRAIKRTTRTELHHEGIYNVKHIHRVIIIIHTMLRVGNIHNGKYVH